MGDIRTSGLGGIPFGDNANRPLNPQTGQPYFNGQTARLELYTGTSFENIVQEVPGVASISGTYSESADLGVITIFGTNFVPGAYATAIGSNGVQINANSTVYNSLVQLTATFTGLSNAYEPYDVKVTNPSNLFGLIPDALYINASPVWQTASGSLGSFAELVNITLSALSATDSDSTISYSLASGSTLPTGLTLNSSTGVISGILSDVSVNTTYNFTINASDGLNAVVPRSFNMTANAAPTWTTASGSIGTVLERDLVAFQFAATDPTSSTLIYSSSNLPSGLSLSSSGILSGVAPGVNTNTTFNFDVVVTDGINNISRAFSLTVNALTQVELLLVGGGGGGGGTISGHHEGAGGGGAGGLYYNATMPITGSHLVTVGNGGVAGTSAGTTGYTGENSVFGTKIALGGGGGGAQYANASSNGINGGSGGGWAGHAGFGRSTNTGLQSSSETGGLGYAGGQASAGGPFGGGGGGGAGGGGTAGSNSSGSSSTGGNGGSGVQYSITGASQFYAGGGGGASQANGSVSSGGSGIGGNGSSGNGSAGSTNTGSGGGGGGASGGNGGNGGSGVVIFAVPGTHTAENIPGTLTFTRDVINRAGHTVYRFTAGTGTITL